jgi:hypothetical protein
MPSFSASPPANLHRDDLHHRLGEVQDRRGGGTDGEGALGASPEGQVPIGCPGGRGGLGLDVALVDRLGGEFPFHDDGGLLEPLLQVAPLELEVAGDVAFLAGVLASLEALHPEPGGHGLV